MLRSDSIGALAKAMSQAQGKMKGAAKDSANPFFKSKYADLASVWDACRDALADAGVAVFQPARAEGAKVTVTTMLAHSEGEWLSEDLTVTAKEESPQAVGSAITYARRYGLASMVGVAPEDDDGEAAHGRETQTTRQPPKPQPAPVPAPDNAHVVRVKRIFDEAKRKGLVMQDHQEALIKLALGKMKGSGQWSNEDMAFIEGILADPDKVQGLIRSCDIQH